MRKPFASIHWHLIHLPTRTSAFPAVSTSARSGRLHPSFRQKNAELVICPPLASPVTIPRFRTITALLALPPISNFQSPIFIFNLSSLCRIPNLSIGNNPLAFPHPCLHPLSRSCSKNPLRGTDVSSVQTRSPPPASSSTTRWRREIENHYTR